MAISLQARRSLKPLRSWTPCEASHRAAGVVVFSQQVPRSVVVEGRLRQQLLQAAFCLLKLPQQPASLTAIPPNRASPPASPSRPPGLGLWDCDVASPVARTPRTCTSAVATSDGVNIAPPCQRSLGFPEPVQSVFGATATSKSARFTVTRLPRPADTVPCLWYGGERGIRLLPQSRRHRTPV